MQIPSVSTSGAVTSAGAAGVGGTVGVAWQICLAALLISLIFALLRFVPRTQR